jgi:hypothetical protein
MTKAAEQYRAALAEAKPKRSKYGNRKTVVNGIEFDSAKEANRWAILKLRERAGEISHLERQPVFYFIIKGEPLKSASGRKLFYKADFSYFEGEKRVVEDVKSEPTRTDIYKLKKALVEHIYGAVKIMEV